ncbi:hypothetical protein [Frankia sp. R82]|uniref:hypothetical protein n=1 Tax=Frankia sp. R82 TaxID=2950553 RepID=UPI002043195D|nr:hypothetical protein [Frankia sp. R82]MCM3887106.1 hypothetical protein [Frankia sp. R82]
MGNGGSREAGRTRSSQQRAAFLASFLAAATLPPGMTRIRAPDPPGSGSGSGSGERGARTHGHAIWLGPPDARLYRVDDERWLLPTAALATALARALDVRPDRGQDPAPGSELGSDPGSDLGIGLGSDLGIGLASDPGSHLDHGKGAAGGSGVDGPGCVRAPPRPDRTARTVNTVDAANAANAANATGAENIEADPDRIETGAGTLVAGSPTSEVLHVSHRGRALARLRLSPGEDTCLPADLVIELTRVVDDQLELLAGTAEALRPPRWHPARWRRAR